MTFKFPTPLPEVPVRDIAPVPALVMVKRTTVGGAPSAAGTPLALDFDAVLHLGGHPRFR